MTNLLKSDFLKIRKDVPFRIIIIVMLIINFFSIGMFKVIEMLSGMMEGTMIMGGLAEFVIMSTLGISNLGLLVAVMNAMFNGKEFSHNTIRNKIIGGNSRVKIYCAAFLTNLSIGMFMFFVTVAESLLLSLIFFQSVGNFGQLVQMIAMSIPLYISFIAVMTFISFATRSQMLGIVFNVLVIVILPSILSIFGMVAAMVLKNDAIIAFLSVIPYQLINDLTSGGIMGSANPIFINGVLSGAFVVKTLISSAILAIAAFFSGLAIFKNADIK